MSCVLSGGGYKHGGPTADTWLPLQPPSCCAREGMETKQKAVGQDSTSDNMLKIPGHVLRPCYLIGSWELAGGAGEITSSCHLFRNKSD